ncbi:MAG TPA: AAA family ATPase, partial [Thermoanaerobaculia bacterium]|nr:AAA family ATPase [Thermoanaerobaculia bacterium]
RVYLIYGHNGSGKSSLVEALELATTGSVDRLKAVDEKRYLQVISYRSNFEAEPAEPARIHLELEEEDAEKPIDRNMEVTEHGISEILDRQQSRYGANSFRLDQTVMDRLGRSGDRMRADTFLSAFFPDDAKIHSDYHTALKAAREARAELPDEVRQKIESLAATTSKKAIENVVIDHLRWLLPPDKKNLTEAPAPLPPEAVEALLPLPFDVLESLIPLAPPIQAFVSRWRATPAPRLEEAEADLRKLDEALKEIQNRFETILPALQTSTQALREMSGWFIEDQDSGSALEDSQAALDAWLERCALADLAERQLQIARTLSAARRADWQVEERGGLFEYVQVAQSELETLERQARRWGEEREEHFRRIASVSRGMRGLAFSGPAGSAPSRARPHLSPPQIAALDQVGAWLPHTTPPPADTKLGNLIRTATQKNRGAYSFGNYRLAHDPEWTKPLADAASRLQTACERLQQLGKGPRMFGGSRRLETLEKVVKKHQAAEKAGAKVTKTLLANLQEVNGALNELMALFTPARWAYPPLRLTHTTAEDGQHTVGVQAGEGTRADLRFNTAELNVFTMALFLLCAVRVPNPLRLLVFDDPLQNMDELTVTTLARGVGRVLRLLPEPWRLMLLFHGLDDLDRFRQEVPSKIYKLPWLTPAEREEGREMPAVQDEAGRRPEFQPLGNLLAAVSAPALTGP